MEEVDNMIFEIHEFLVQLNKVRECKTISCSLAKSFESILNSIENILDDQPTLIESESETNCILNLTENSIKRKYFCEVCSDYIQDDLNSLRTHISSSKHIHSKQNFVEVPREVRSEPLSIKAQNGFNVVDFSKQDSKLQKTYNEILPFEQAEKINNKKFENFLNSFLPIIAAKCKMNSVHLYGSRFYCISKPYSDYNVFVDVKGSNSISLNQDPYQISLVTSVSKMCRDGGKFRVFNSSGSILQLNDLDQGLVFNVSFTNSYMKIYKAVLIKYLFQSSLHRKVCHIILRISTIYNFEGTSYNMVLLLLYYYQTKNILPPIYYLQKDLLPINYGGWQVNFASKPLYLYCGQNSLIDNYENCILNLIDFFKFYAKFDFEKYIICPHLGCAIPRSEFDNIMFQIPSYPFFVIKNPSNRFNINSQGANIQDPIELNVNNFIREAKIKRFQTFCRKVAETNVISLS